MVALYLCDPMSSANHITIATDLPSRYPAANPVKSHHAHVLQVCIIISWSHPLSQNFNFQGFQWFISLQKRILNSLRFQLLLSVQS